MKTKITVDSVEKPTDKKAWQVKGNGKTFFSKEEISKELEGRPVEITYHENTYNDKKYLWVEGITETPREFRVEPEMSSARADGTLQVAVNIATMLTAKIIENQKDITVERSVVVWKYLKEEILKGMRT